MRSDALASHRRHAPSPRPGDRSQELPAAEPALHRSDCYTVVSGFAFFGALAFAESAETIPDAHAYATAIADRIPDCDCFTSSGD